MLAQLKYPNYPWVLLFLHSPHLIHHEVLLTWPPKTAGIHLLLSISATTTVVLHVNILSHLEYSNRLLSFQSVFSQSTLQSRVTFLKSPLSASCWDTPKAAHFLVDFIKIKSKFSIHLYDLVPWPTDLIPFHSSFILYAVIALSFFQSLKEGQGVGRKAWEKLILPLGLCTSLFPLPETLLPWSLLVPYHSSLISNMLSLERLSFTTASIQSEGRQIGANRKSTEDF